MTGQPRVEYSVILNTPAGDRLEIPGDVIGLKASGVVSGVSVVTLELPGDYPADAFALDSILEVNRWPVGGVGGLLFEKVFFLRRPLWTNKDGRERWSLTAYCPNYLWGDPGNRAGRNIAYNASNAYTTKVAPADNMLKAIARENAGSLATDTTRDLSAYLQIAADASPGLGATLRKEFARRNALIVFQELAQASAEAGSYIAFDTVCVRPPSDGALMLEFRTYAGQRGADHRSGTKNRVLIGPDAGNLSEVELDFDATGEANFIYAGGQKFGDIQAIETAQDDARIGLSPFNRRETFVESGNTSDPEALVDEAESALRAGKARRQMRGTLLDTDQARFGLEWGWGDYLTSVVKGIAFDCRADVVEIEYSLAAGEVIRPSLIGDLV